MKNSYLKVSVPSRGNRVIDSRWKEDPPLPGLRVSVPSRGNRVIDFSAVEFGLDTDWWVSVPSRGNRVIDLELAAELVAREDRGFRPLSGK